MNYTNKQIILAALFMHMQNKLSKQAYNEIKIFVDNPYWEKTDKNYYKYFELLYDHEIIQANDYFDILNVLDFIN